MQTQVGSIVETPKTFKKWGINTKYFHFLHLLRFSDWWHYWAANILCYFVWNQHFSILYLTASFLLLSALYMTADYYDLPGDAKRKLKLQSLLLIRSQKIKEIKQLILFFFSLSYCLMAMVGIWSILFSLLTLIPGFLYSHPKYFWKGKPFLDLLAIAILYTLIILTPVKILSSEVILFAIWVGVLSMMGHICQSLADLSEDRQLGIQTTVTVLDMKWITLLFKILVLLAGSLPVLIIKPALYYLSFVLFFPFLIFSLSHSQIIWRALKVSAAITLIFSAESMYPF